MPLHFNIQGTQFVADDPVLNTALLRNEAGVYIILGRNLPSENWTVLDVGESEDVRTRVTSHDRAGDWRGCGYQVISAAVIYNINNGQQGRRWVEQNLRQQYAPQCGVY